MDSFMRSNVTHQKHGDVVIDMQEAQLTPLAANDDDDGVQKVENLGEVENPQNGRHSGLLGIEVVAEEHVLVVVYILESLKDHV